MQYNSKQWEPNPIAPMEMLKLLMEIYTKTSVKPVTLSLGEVVRGSAVSAIRNKKTLILRALLAEGVVTNSGSRRSPVWYWNLEGAGPPTLCMAREVLYAMSRIASEASRQYKARKRNADASRT